MTFFLKDSSVQENDSYASQQSCFTPGNVDGTCPENKLECFSAASLITKMKNYSYWTLLSPEPNVRNLLQSAFMNVHKKLECWSLAGLSLMFVTKARSLPEGNLKR